MDWCERVFALQGGLFLEQGELDFLFHWIDPVDQHANSLPQAVDLVAALADNFAGIFVIGVTVVGQSIQRHQALHEEVGQLHEESILGHADNQSVEVFADAILHELDLLPFHELAFSFVGATLGLAGFLGDVMQFLDRYWSALGPKGFAMCRVVAPLRPRRTRSAGILPARWRAGSPRQFAAGSFPVRRP